MAVAVPARELLHPESRSALIHEVSVAVETDACDDRSEHLPVGFGAGQDGLEIEGVQRIGGCLESVVEEGEFAGVVGRCGEKAREGKRGIVRREEDVSVEREEEGEREVQAVHTLTREERHDGGCILQETLHTTRTLRDLPSRLIIIIVSLHSRNAVSSSLNHLLMPLVPITNFIITRSFSFISPKAMLLTIPSNTVFKCTEGISSEREVTSS